jgi:hypothetical protein
MTALCEACQNVDIRNLLLVSLENKSEDSPFFHPRLESSFKYHDSILCLRAGAQAGCPLCGLIWQGCNSRPWEIDETARPQLTDAQLNERWPGQLFSGTSSWKDEEYPSLVVTSEYVETQQGKPLHPPQKSTCCVLDVFAERGEVP